MSKLNSKLYSAPLDQAGKEIQFDIREDEEQQKKLQETLELLVAAGYFRARIKGLSAFDKIVGGMTWCITTCNFDVDVDLLFQESSTIGQKITLTERIVSVLPRMKCPHGIEPHQIQGFDFKNIYPVIQWLVKRAIETRAEMGDLNRSFALSQFLKMDREQPNEAELSKTQNAIKSLENLKEQNAPQRKFKRDFNKVTDKQVKIQQTLLEYGQQNILLSNLLSQQQQQQTSGTLTQKQAQEQHQKQQQANNAVIEEEKHLKRLINEMSETDQKQNKVTASTVGQILGLQQTALKQIVDEFADKDNQLQNDIDHLEKLAASGNESFGGLQHKQRLINILHKQIEQKHTDLDEKKSEINKINENLETFNQNFANLKTIENSLQDKLLKLEEFEKNVDKKSVDKLQQLVLINDELKQKEQDYKKKCKEELLKFEDELENLRNKEISLPSDENERFEKINEQYETSKAKVNMLRLKNAKKNREISVLKRKLDEIPSRIELTQYQKRFIELFNQMSSVHTQTKQFYIFYNVLEDKKLYMNKEINLLNSIHDQFNQAMSTLTNREQFIKQLEIILDGIKQSLSKIEHKKSDVKSKCDELNDKFIGLIEKKRVYYKTLRDFQEECKRNLELNQLDSNK